MVSRFWNRFLAGTAVIAALAAVGCGETETPTDTNLVRNGSFEKVGGDGIPEDWELVVFRGLPGQEEVRYGVDNTTASDGSNSWTFEGDKGTKRWYALAQEIEVRNVTHVRLRGSMQLSDVGLQQEQYAQCNFVLSFYDEDHRRFQELRFADKRSRLKDGTALWFDEDLTFRVPEGTRYIAVMCVLGMSGKVWFDDVSLTVPNRISWESKTTSNYVYHWLPGNPPPDGAIDRQQQMFDYYCDRLGIESDVVVKYYFYPDTATIREILSLKGAQYTSWDDREHHSVNPIDDHEVVHFITDVYGRPPRALAEGSVYWLQGRWGDMPIPELAAELYRRGRLAPLEKIANYNDFMLLEPVVSIPTAASFIQYLAERYGTEKLLELFQQVSGVNSYDAFAQVLEIVYGAPAPQIEEEWRAAVGRMARAQGDGGE